MTKKKKTASKPKGTVEKQIPASVGTKVPGADYVKKQTLILTACMCLVVGFLAGVVMTVYKTGSQPPITAGKPIGNLTPGAADSGVIQMLEKEAERNPGSADAWIALANSYFDAERHQNAIEAYQKALAIAPNNANVITDMGVMYRRSGQPQKAVAAFDRAIKVDPEHETARFNKGIVLFHDLKDNDGAIAAWEDLLNVNPMAKAPGGQSLQMMVEQFKKNQ